MGAGTDQRLLLWRASGPFRAQRFAAGSACPIAVHAARSAGPRMAEPRPLRRRERSPRLRLEGQSQRTRRPQDPWPQPRRPGACIEADRRRSRRRGLRQPGSDAGRGGQRRPDDRPGSGPLRADRQWRAAWRIVQRTLVRAASLRRAGGHFVAAVRYGDLRPHRPGCDRRRHWRPAGRPDDPRVGTNEQRSARERGDRHFARAASGGRPVQRIAPHLQPSCRNDTWRRSDRRQRAPSISRAARRRSTFPSTRARP